MRHEPRCPIIQNYGTPFFVGVRTSPQPTGYDKTIRLWNVADGSGLIVLKGHTDAVTQVGFSPDGKQLASIGKEDCIIRIWNLDLDDLLLRGCKWAYDYLKYNPNISEEDRHLCDDILSLSEP